MTYMKKLKNIVSAKVLFWGVLLLFPAFYLSSVFGNVGRSALIYLGCVFHAAVVYQAAVMRNKSDN